MSHMQAKWNIHAFSHKQTIIHVLPGTRIPVPVYGPHIRQKFYSHNPGPPAGGGPHLHLPTALDPHRCCVTNKLGAETFYLPSQPHSSSLPKLDRVCSKITHDYFKKQWIDYCSDLHGLGFWHWSFSDEWSTQTEFRHVDKFVII